MNPLALEEFAALEERYRFLSTQLEDLKNTRRDLLTVVSEVDDKILEVFTTAYHDVAREFEIVFSTLFPGGEGRLVLTDPDDMLTTGIEVEARPPGKKVKRLSLLSGGERSLTAMALLVAIFRARPSPFYVLDEIEAALDDVNLRRLIALMEELRATSQLIVITHQKPTMEVADALYGVSMRGDGITTVISQRLRPAPPTPRCSDGPARRFPAVARRPCAQRVPHGELRTAAARCERSRRAAGLRRAGSGAAPRPARGSRTSRGIGVPRRPCSPCDVGHVPARTGRPGRLARHMCSRAHPGARGNPVRRAGSARPGAAVPRARPARGGARSARSGRRDRVVG